jgi:LPLT family lysophospholipid transporter-like MFS transporter
MHLEHTASAAQAPALPGSFHQLIAAQFFAALADNALLIVTMALLQQRQLPMWWAPMLKLLFTLAHVLLAPWVGLWADAAPKARTMAWMNGLKAAAVVALLAGAHPLAFFAVLGMASATYVPAKYGLVTELVKPQTLVAANAWIEVSVVGAVLLGTALGGGLVSQAWQGLAMACLGPVGHWLGTESGLVLALVVVLATYGTSALLNAGLPDSGARYAAGPTGLAAPLRAFRQANRTLWGDRLGGLSLAVTTLFWGVGAILQFAVLRWAQTVLQLPLSQAALMQAAVAVGVVLGASVAGRCLRLALAPRLMPVGIVLGLLIAGAACVTSQAAALAMLALVGAVGGLLVVPMNALLQHRGHTLLSAGRSIAVQSFNENLGMGLMLAAYALLTALDMPIVPLLWGLGGTVAVLMAALMRRPR